MHPRLPTLILLALHPLISALQCGQVGSCQGHFVLDVITDSANDCIRLCHDYNNCKWYTYFNDSKDCLLASDCAAVDESCTTCEHGQKACLPSDDYDKLLVVSGIGSDYTSEIIDLSPQNLTCVNPSPLPIMSGSVGALIDDTVVVCGGGNSSELSLCYTLNPSTLEWTQSSIALEMPRRMAASVQMTPSDWWITGGYADFEHWSSTESWMSEFNKFDLSWDLPETLQEHNAVKVNVSHVMILGGTGTKKAWLVDVTNGVWTPLPDERNSRYSSYAGRLITADGDVEVMVVGGKNEKTSEIYSLTTGLWRYGPRLDVDKELFMGSSVQIGNTFMIVGGFMNGDGSKDWIMQYNVEAKRWDKRSVSLGRSRYHATAMLIPSSYVSCS